MKTVVFSGTSDGKEIAEYLSGKKIETIVCVATEYGSYVMPKMQGVSVNVGRLDVDEMSALVLGADFVIDATHPYAELVTENIMTACKNTDTEYIRLLRDEETADNVILADNIDNAVEMLEDTEGKIFVSTGSKELGKYTALDNYSERLVVRVLPVKESEEKCSELGIKNVIYQKGPFSYEQNTEQFRAYGVRWLVTKSSGKAGGFDEKVRAAKDLGINVIVVKRPRPSSSPSSSLGLQLDEVKRVIDSKCKGKSI